MAPTLLGLTLVARQEELVKRGEAWLGIIEADGSVAAVVVVAREASLST